jgi:hypothetical protein
LGELRKTFPLVVYWPQEVHRMLRKGHAKLTFVGFEAAPGRVHGMREGSKSEG